MDTRHGEADIITRTQIEWPLVDHPDLLIVVHHIGCLVVHRQVGEHAQATRCIPIAHGQLLLRDHPPTVLAAM
ncbi:hypothetical protein D9M68_768250 [compost metagenome]